jgi:hypothetical protein
MLDHQHEQQLSPQQRFKRQRPQDELDMSLLTPADMQVLSTGQLGAFQVPAPSQPTHHHHRLPTLPQGLAYDPLTGHPLSPSTSSSSHPNPHNPSALSLVGAPGYPPPAPAPKVAKLKFTPKDDALLVQLKEEKNLTWKQIAEFFPGRSSGTLQVRYCTKLRVKGGTGESGDEGMELSGGRGGKTGWNEEKVLRLRRALVEYEREKWRVVANRVGGGVSEGMCRVMAGRLGIDGSVLTGTGRIEEEEDDDDEEQQEEGEQEDDDDDDDDESDEEDVEQAE